MSDSESSGASSISEDTPFFQFRMFSEKSLDVSAHALRSAIISSDVETVTTILSDPNTLRLHRHAGSGANSLHLAARFGDSEICRLLIAFIKNRAALVKNQITQQRVAKEMKSKKDGLKSPDVADSEMPTGEKLLHSIRDRQGKSSTLSYWVDARADGWTPIGITMRRAHNLDRFPSQMAKHIAFARVLVEEGHANPICRIRHGPWAIEAVSYAMTKHWPDLVASFLTSTSCEQAIIARGPQFAIDLLWARNTFCEYSMAFHVSTDEKVSVRKLVLQTLRRWLELERQPLPGEVASQMTYPDLPIVKSPEPNMDSDQDPDHQIGEWTDQNEDNPMLPGQPSVDSTALNDEEEERSGSVGQGLHSNASNNPTPDPEPTEISIEEQRFPLHYLAHRALNSSEHSNYYTYYSSNYAASNIGFDVLEQVLAIDQLLSPTSVISREYLYDLLRSTINGKCNAVNKCQIVAHLQSLGCDMDLYSTTEYPPLYLALFDVSWEEALCDRGLQMLLDAGADIGTIHVDSLRSGSVCKLRLLHADSNCLADGPPITQ